MKEVKSLKHEVVKFKREVEMLKDKHPVNENFKEKIQDSERLEEKVIMLRKKLDEKSVQSKFENNSRI